MRLKNHLTPREVEVAQTFYELDGERDEICQCLGMRITTLRTHLHSLFNYFGVNSSVALMKVLIESGSVTLDTEVRRAICRRVG